MSIYNNNNQHSFSIPQDQMPNHNVVLPMSVQDIQRSAPIRIQPARKQLRVMSDFDNGLVRKTMEKRQCYIKKEDESLFNNIVSFYNENLLGNTYEDALSKFAKEPNGDVLVKLVYGSPFQDYILRYSTKDEKEEQIYERHRYEKLLYDHGLYFEKDDYSMENEVYVKILAPFETLCKEAENMKLKFELAETEMTVNRAVVDNSGKLSSLKIRETIDSLSSIFVRAHLDNFKGGSIEKLGTAHVYDNFFASSKRILITYTLVARLRLEKYKKSRSVNLKTLINDGVFDESYPCHDGPYYNERGRLRHFLDINWLPLSRMLHKQPLDAIRDYFGEKIGFYFAYLGYYTISLIFAALLGLLAFGYGMYKYFLTSSDESNALVAISRIFDNEVTIIYTFVMSVWATIFLEYLRRQTTKIAFDWDVLNYEKEEVQRAGFKPTFVRVSPITGKWEKYQPRSVYKSKMLISFLIVFVCILIVLASVGSMIWFRVTSRQNLLSSIFSLVIIVVLGKVYLKIAYILTNWENHRTETEYETSFIAKRFLFDFVNYYSSLLYIGLAKNLLLETIPGFGDHCYIACDQEECWNSCMVDLTQQLAIIFVGKQIINQLMEYGAPYVMGLFPYIKREIIVRLSMSPDKMEKYLEDKEKYAVELRKLESGPQYVRDDKLHQNAGLIDEYNEMAIQFGFVMLFVASFPLGALFALVNNIFEIRIDAKKFVREWQRPVPFPASNIGVWHTILNVVAHIAVLTNAGLIALTSEYFDDNYLRGLDMYHRRFVQLAFIFAYEHAVFAMKAALSFLIPDTPQRIKDAIEREEYITKVKFGGQNPAEDDPEALALKDKPSIIKALHLD